MPPAVCSVTKLGVPPLGRWSRTVARTPAAPHVAGLRGRTLTALVQTLRDAEDAWLLGRLSKTTINGLVGGRMVPDAVKTLRLTAYSAIHGLSLTGTIVLARDRLSGQPAFPLRAASGTLAVTGVASGNVRVNGHKLAGMLGGKPVAAGF
jgi:hypothetical protein